MKKIIILLLISLFLGCGKEPAGNPSLSTLSQISNTPIYIIGGQSNAMGILNTVNGQVWNTVPTLFTNSSIANGYAVGGTPISYWLDTTNSQPLFNIVSNNCSLNSKVYFVWWQGEADSTQNLFPFFYQNTLTFLNSVQALCPSLKIIVMTIETAANPTTPAVLWIQQAQVALPFLHYSAVGYPMQTDWLHLEPTSYQNLWNSLIQTYN